MHLHGMMSAVKTVVILLALALALLGSQAAPTGPECDGLNRTVSRDHLHKVNGQWVLVYSVSHGQFSGELMANLTSNHVEIQQVDDSTITYYERNLNGGECTIYSANMTVTSEDNGYKISINNALVEKNGKVIMENLTEEVSIFESCPDCLNILFAGDAGVFLMIYRREGHHRDPEQVRSFHSDYDKLAECLNVPQSHKFIYDGVADFCHKKSSPENSN